MIIRPAICVRIAAALVVVGAASNCATTVEPSGGNGNTAVNGNNPTGTTGAAGASAMGTTAAGSVDMTGTTAAGGTATTAVTSGGASTSTVSGVNPDASCASSGTATSGAVCTLDCDVGCGFDSIGNKHCTCVGGVYESCPCSPPADFPATLTMAAFCLDVIGPGADGTTNGIVDDYDEGECTTRYDACITAEDNDTPRGCLCLDNGDSTTGFAWSCGSTNNWFDRPAGGAVVAGTGGATAAGGAATSGGAATAAGGATTASGGAATAAGGATTASGGAGTNPDASCESSGTATSGAVCTVDCDVPCGFDKIGNKHCNCVDGAYESCPCGPPADFPAELTTAPDCLTVIGPGADGTTNGLIDDYDEGECAAKYDACITAETDDTPRGCLCVDSATSSTGFEWNCGSTNKWFLRETQ